MIILVTELLIFKETSIFLYISNELFKDLPANLKSYNPTTNYRHVMYARYVL